MTCFVCGGQLAPGAPVAVTGHPGDRDVTIWLHATCATHLAERVLASLHALRQDSPPPLAASPRQRFGLTDKELRLLHGVVAGETNVQIARRLGLSPQHVRNQVSTILAKLEASSRTQAAVIALRYGLVEVRDSALAM